MNQSFAFHLHEHVIKAEVGDDNALAFRISLPGAVCQHTDIVFFAKSLDVLLDLGYEIVNAVRKLQPVVPDATEEAWTNAVTDIIDSQPITAVEARETMQRLIDAVNKRPVNLADAVAHVTSEGFELPE